MYLPYFRGKQHELGALAGCAPDLAATGKVLPIIEPVNKRTVDLYKFAKEWAAASLPVALVVNPSVGEMRGDHSIVTETQLPKLESLGVQMTAAYLVDPNTRPASVESFLGFARGRPVLFVHQGEPREADALRAAIGSRADVRHLFVEGASSKEYQDLFSDSFRAVLRDGFRERVRNADYPASDFFSDLHATHGRLGLQGFGDYSIVGAKYKEGRGGPAFAVAIHMTVEEKGKIWCRHYVSDSNMTNKDPAGKFDEAVTKLVDAGRASPGLLDFSKGYERFAACQSTGTFPNLGFVKRFSMMHHLQLVARLLR